MLPCPVSLAAAGVLPTTGTAGTMEALPGTGAAKTTGALVTGAGGAAAPRPNVLPCPVSLAVAGALPTTGAAGRREALPWTGTVETVGAATDATVGAVPTAAAAGGPAFAIAAAAGPLAVAPAEGALAATVRWPAYWPPVLLPGSSNRRT
jgi:hypothetical protein